MVCGCTCRLKCMQTMSYCSWRWTYLLEAGLLRSSHMLEVGLPLIKCFWCSYASAESGLCNTIDTIPMATRMDLVRTVHTIRARVSEKLKYCCINRGWTDLRNYVCTIIVIIVIIIQTAQPLTWLDGARSGSPQLLLCQAFRNPRPYLRILLSLSVHVCVKSYLERCHILNPHYYGIVPWMGESLGLPPPPLDRKTSGMCSIMGEQEWPHNGRMSCMWA